ncbi:MAG: nucleoside 2-deoxyribosyltransferase domain-containing protein [Alphaproteobacteria bacterium]
MRVIFANQKLPETPRSGIVENSLFLVGPTPRDEGVPSWRPQAIEILKRRGFDGYVFVPEDDLWGFQGDYDHQVWWEIEGLGKSAVIACWLDRKMPDMPAFTTNTEVGMALMARPDRFVLGAPDDAVKVRYQKTLAGQIGRLHCAFGMSSPVQEVPIVSSLEDLMVKSMEMAKPRTVWGRRDVEDEMNY